MENKIKAPQANNVEKLIKLTESLEQHRSKDEVLKEILVEHDDRQYLYYYDALVFLGIAKSYKYNNNTQYEAYSKDILKKIKEFGGEKIVVDAIKENKYIKAFNSEPNEVLEKMLAEDFNLSGSTLPRRISTIKTWAKFVEDK